MKWLRSFLHSIKSFSYKNQKELAQKGTVKQRLTLAASSKTNKEILFYLAEHDPESIVRERVAKNLVTPLHANKILAADMHEDVRLALSGRLVKLLPALSIDKQSQLYAYTVQTLGTLALDEVLKIRKSLAVTLKDHAHAPPSVVAQLAKDIERDVAEPILRFCIALEDQALIEILESHPAEWAAEAVARRPKLSSKVSMAVLGTNNKKAGQYLIENKGADLNEDVLHEIIIRAREFSEWHVPLVKNHTLPLKLARRLARFTDSRIRKLLQERGGFELNESEIVVDATRRRIKLEEEIKNRSASNLKKHIQKLDKTDRLTEETIKDHLALRDKEFVYSALAYKVKIAPAKVKKIFSLKKPETICSLCWKARLSMRFAFQVQQELAGISHRELLVPKDGTDYPLSEEKMQWHLKFLDI